MCEKPKYMCKEHLPTHTGKLCSQKCAFYVKTVRENATHFMSDATHFRFKMLRIFRPCYAKNYAF